MLNDYKYAIRTTNQVGNYNKVTTYLTLHTRKSYEHGSDITNAIEEQEHFNFNPSTPRLKISSTVEAEDSTPHKKVEIKHENDQYKIEYKAELQLHLKQKVIIA